MNNTAAVSVGGNQIAGFLLCTGNRPVPVDGGGNVVAGGTFGQCAGF